MAAYRRVYDSRHLTHLQADCQEPGSAPDPALGNRAWATFTFYTVRIVFKRRIKLTCIYSGQSLERARAYCSPAAEMMLSRPRSTTPTVHDQIARDRQRPSDESTRAGNVGVARSSPHRLPPGETCVKRQHEKGWGERSRSSEHTRPPQVRLLTRVDINRDFLNKN